MLKRIPDTFIIIFLLILFACILTWIMPGGQYTEASNGQLVYSEVESTPQTWQVFTAFQKGFEKQASIIIFVLIVGGVFWIINASKAIDVGILSLLDRMKKWEQKQVLSSKLASQIILVLIMLIFSVFGAVFGMSEETIAFVGILIPLTISLGYDSITGVAAVFVAAGLGFAGAVLNPFTIGIAQEIAELQMFSGLEYRMFCWLIINISGITFILIYANRIRKNPKKSRVYEHDYFWRKRIAESNHTSSKPTKRSWAVFITISIILVIFSFLYPISNLNLGSSSYTISILPLSTFLFIISNIYILRKSNQFFILNLLGFTILFLLVGVMGYEWYINEISAIFFATGIATGIAINKTGNQIVKLFLEGARDIIGAALIIGLASGIIVILEEGHIRDTILYKASNLMDGMGKVSTIGTMYAIQNLINVVIPSGSAKAAITMPIMAPFSDLVGLSRQATVMAFQFGDGFTNLITPTSGVMMGVISIAKIPYSIWFRWIAPLITILILIGFLLLIPTVLMDLNGF